MEPMGHPLAGAAHDGVRVCGLRDTLILSTRPFLATRVVARDDDAGGLVHAPIVVLDSRDARAATNRRWPRC